MPHAGKDVALLHRQHMRRTAMLLSAMQACGPGQYGTAHRQYAKEAMHYNDVLTRVRELSPEVFEQRSLFNCETLEEGTPLDVGMWVRAHTPRCC